LSGDSSSLWQQDIQSYKQDTLEDKQAKELARDSWIEKIKNSKFVGLFYFLYVVFLPLMLLIEVAILATPGYGRRRTRGLFFTRIFSKKNR